jgi:hypothetical protein
VRCVQSQGPPLGWGLCKEPQRTAAATPSKQPLFTACRALILVYTSHPMHQQIPAQLLLCVSFCFAQRDHRGA